MANIVVIGLHGGYLSSVGSMIDAHAMLEELFRSNDALGAYAEIQTRIEILTAQGEPVRLAGGRTMAADGAWGAARRPRLIFLPAFQISQRDDIAEIVRRAAPLHDFLRNHASHGVVIGAAGASALHIAASGLADTGPVSCPLRLADSAVRLFPGLSIAPPDKVTFAGANVMTCADRRLAGDFAAGLIARAVSEGSLRWLEIRQGLGGHASGQAGLSGDDLVARAQLILREQFASELNIAGLARRLSVSHHTLIRRFRQSVGVTPLRYRQQARIEAACVMLRETKRSVGEIGLLVGYSDARSFREAFVREQNISPSEFRRRNLRPT